LNTGSIIFPLNFLTQTILPDRIVILYTLQILKQYALRDRAICNPHCVISEEIGIENLLENCGFLLNFNYGYWIPLVETVFVLLSVRWQLEFLVY
jgi:hypothetical protein